MPDSFISLDSLRQAVERKDSLPPDAQAVVTRLEHMTPQLVMSLGVIRDARARGFANDTARDAFVSRIIDSQFPGVEGLPFKSKLATIYGDNATPDDVIQHAEKLLKIRGGEGDKLKGLLSTRAADFDTYREQVLTWEDSRRKHDAAARVQAPGIRVKKGINGVSLDIFSPVPVDASGGDDEAFADIEKRFLRSQAKDSPYFRFRAAEQGLTWRSREIAKRIALKGTSALNDKDLFGLFMSMPKAERPAAYAYVSALSADADASKVAQAFSRGVKLDEAAQHAFGIRLRTIADRLTEEGGLSVPPPDVVYTALADAFNADLTLPNGDPIFNKAGTAFASPRALHEARQALLPLFRSRGGRESAAAEILSQQAPGNADVINALDAAMPYIPALATAAGKTEEALKARLALADALSPQPKADGLVEKYFLGAVEALPFIPGVAATSASATVLSGGGPVTGVLAAGAYMTSIMQPNMEQSLLDQGAPPTAARSLSVMASVPMAQLENLQLGLLKGLAKGAGKAAFTQGLARSFPKRVAAFTKQVGKDALIRFGEEMAIEDSQSLLEALMYDAAYEFGNAHNKKRSDIWSQFGQDLKDNAGVMFFLTMPFAATGGIANSANLLHGNLASRATLDERLRSLADSVGGRATSNVASSDAASLAIAREYADAGTEAERDAIVQRAGFPGDVAERKAALDDMAKALDGADASFTEARDKIVASMEQELAEEDVAMPGAGYEDVAALPDEALPDLSVVDALAGRYPGAPEMTVVDRVSDLAGAGATEADLARMRQRQGDGQAIRGFVSSDGARIFMVRESIGSRAEAVQVWAHEVGGHIGVGILEETDVELWQHANDLITDDMLRDRFGTLAETMGRQLSVREYLASMAEDVLSSDTLDLRDRTLWDKLKQFFRDLLGLSTDRQLRDRELADIVRIATRSALAGDRVNSAPASYRAGDEGAPLSPAKDANGEPLFSVKQRQTPEREFVVSLAYKMINGTRAAITKQKAVKLAGLYNLTDDNGLVSDSLKRASDIVRLANSVGLKSDIRGTIKLLRQLEILSRADQDVFREFMATYYSKGAYDLQGQSDRIQAARAKLEARQGMSLFQMAKERVLLVDLMKQLIGLEKVRKPSQKSKKAAGAQEETAADQAAAGPSLEELILSGRRKRIEAYIKKLRTAIANSGKTRFGTKEFIEDYKKTVSRLLDKIGRDRTMSRQRETVLNLAHEVLDARTDKQVTSALRRGIKTAFAGQVRETRTALNKKLGQLLRRVPSRPASGSARWDKQKIGALARNRLAYAKRAVKMSFEEVQAEIERLNTELGRTPRKTEGGDIEAAWLRLADQTQMLARFGALKFRPVADLADAVRWLENDFASALATQQAKIDQLNEHREKLRKPFLDSFRKAQRYTNPDVGRRGFFDRTGTYAMSFWQRLRDITRFAQDSPDIQAAVDYLAVRVSDASHRLEALKLEGAKALEDTVRKAYGLTTEIQVRAKLRELKAVDPTTKRFSLRNTMLSRQAVLNIFAAIEQDDLLPGEGETGGEGGPLPLANRAAMRDALLEYLTNEDLAFLKGMRELYIKDRERGNEMARRATGLGIEPPGPKYMPIRRFRPGGATTIVAEPKLVPPGFTRRVRTNLDIDETIGVIDMYQDRRDQMDVFLSFYDVNMDLRGVFLHPDTQKQFIQAFGSDAWNEFENHLLRVMSQKGINSRGKLSPILSSILTASSLKVALNAAVVLKQIASIVSPIIDYGPRTFSRRLKEIATTDKGKWYSAQVFNSEQARVRLARGNDQVTAILRSPSPGASKVENVLDFLHQYVRIGLRPNQIMDRATIGLAGGIVFGEHYEQIKASGDNATEEEVISKALSRTWAEINETQQSPLELNKAPWQANKTGVSLIGQFVPTPQQYFALQAAEFRRAKAAKQLGLPHARRRLARILLVNHLLIPTILKTADVMLNVVLGQPPSEDDLKEYFVSLALGPASGWFLGRSLVTAFASGLTDGAVYAADHFVPATSLLYDTKNVGDAINELVIHFDPEKASEDVWRVIARNFPPGRYAGKLADFLTDD